MSKHYESIDGIWLVFHKKSSGKSTIDYDEAVEEAICFGWIDVRIRRIDDPSTHDASRGAVREAIGRTATGVVH